MSYNLQGKSVLITGAAMGMGRLYALKAVAEKATNIILWDINQQKLEETASQLKEKNRSVNVYTNVVDLGQLEEIERAAEETRALPNISSLDVLINNAGVISGNNYFWDLDNRKDAYFTMSINALAPMYVTSFFINDMITDTTKAKRILNVASAAGLVSNPNMSVYAASKWSCLGWSDSLRLELKKSGCDHIKVTTFCPTYISTGMFEGAKGLLLAPVITPETAVNAAWHGMKRGVPIVYKPSTIRLSGVLKGILPIRIWDWVAENVIKIYSSMEDFKGQSH